MPKVSLQTNVNSQTAVSVSAVCSGLRANTSVKLLLDKQTTLDASTTDINGNLNYAFQIPSENQGEVSALCVVLGKDGSYYGVSVEYNSAVTNSGLVIFGFGSETSTLELSY